MLKSHRPEVFYKKAALKNFGKSTGKHLCQSLFFNKVAGDACNFIKKETLAQVFSSKSAKFLRTPSHDCLNYTKEFHNTDKSAPTVPFMLKSLCSTANSTQSSFEAALNVNNSGEGKLKFP